MTPQNNPTINPAKTSNKVCCFTMIPVSYTHLTLPTNSLV